MDSKTSSIDFSKISSIEKEKSEDDSLKNANKVFFAIFQRSLLKMLKSKIFIIVTILFSAAFIFNTLLLVFMSKQDSFGTNMISYYMAFVLLIGYLTYFEIHSTSSIFNNELRDGVVNLEIRSGKSKRKIFFERFFANKIIIFSYIMLMSFLMFILAFMSSNFYVKTSIISLVPSMLILCILIDLLI